MALRWPTKWHCICDHWHARPRIVENFRRIPCTITPGSTGTYTLLTYYRNPLTPASWSSNMPFKANLPDYYNFDRWTSPSTEPQPMLSANHFKLSVERVRLSRSPTYNPFDPYPASFSNPGSSSRKQACNPTSISDDEDEIVKEEEEVTTIVIWGWY